MLGAENMNSSIKHLTENDGIIKVIKITFYFIGTVPSSFVDADKSPIVVETNLLLTGYFTQARLNKVVKSALYEFRKFHI